MRDWLVLLLMFCLVLFLGFLGMKADADKDSMCRSKGGQVQHISHGDDLCWKNGQVLYVMEK